MACKFARGLKARATLCPQNDALAKSAVADTGPLKVPMLRIHTRTNVPCEYLGPFSTAA